MSTSSLAYAATQVPRDARYGETGLRARLPDPMQQNHHLGLEAGAVLLPHAVQPTAFAQVELSSFMDPLCPAAAPFYATTTRFTTVAKAAGQAVR